MYKIPTAADDRHLFTWIPKDYAEYWKFMDLPLSGDYKDKIITISSNDDVKNFEIFIRCRNCDRVFPSKQFDEHICDFIDPNTMIYDDEKISILWENSALRKMYAENNAQIDQILQIYNVNVTVRPKQAKKQSAMQGNHKCAVCQRMYVHASGLSRHMETQHSTIESNDQSIHQPVNAEETIAEVIKCLICGQIFNSFSSCFSHLKTSHTEFGFDESNYSVQMGESVLFEKLTVDQLIQCEFCDRLYADTMGLFQHKNKHDINSGYECSSCQLASRNLKFILNHRNNECPYELYEKSPIVGCKVCFACSECYGTFDSLALLYEHRYSKQHFVNLLNQSTGQNEYFCEKCDQVFGADPHELVSHTESAHTTRGRIQSLATATLTRPYLCEVCGKGYTQSSHLYQHLRFHRGIKPFECPKEGCNRKFTIRPDLNDHIRKCHTGERPYKCTDCNKTFLTGSVYYQHRLIHRNERRYGCRTCEKRFHRSDALKNHERIHSGEKPYACGVCSKTFRQKGDRDKHFRSRHKREGSTTTFFQDENPVKFLIDMTKMPTILQQISGLGNHTASDD